MKSFMSKPVSKARALAPLSVISQLSARLPVWSIHRSRALHRARASHLDAQTHMRQWALCLFRTAGRSPVIAFLSLVRRSSPFGEIQFRTSVIDVTDGEPRDGSDIRV